MTPAQMMFSFDKESFDVQTEEYGGRVVVTIRQKEDRPVPPPRSNGSDNGSDSK